MASISVAGIEKRFGSTTVLDGVTLAIPDGSFAVLVGPSGCGKSTLLRLLAGLERPSAGTVHFGGRDVTALPPRDRDIAMVFQSYALYPHLSVQDNLAFGLRLRKTPEAEVAVRVGEASRMLGLDRLLERMPRELSGGQRQRVAMGRAIVRRAQVFLFDEPLSNLDAALRGQVRVEIKKLHDALKTTSVYVTHDQVEAMTLADVMFVLNHGRIEQSGAPLAIYDRPRTRFVAGFLGSPAMNLLDGELRHEGGAWSVLLGDTSVTLSLAEADFGVELRAGRRVTVGVRPHDLVPCEARARGVGEAPLAAREATEPGARGASAHATGPSRLNFVVTMSEPLGGETFAHGTIAGLSAVVRLDAKLAVRANELLALAIEPGRVHLFDADSGLALRC
ncbi:MAG: sn-glycerol-3-phosphate ABC transporter ATP-binding protein UgpC [Myxococcales bacterium]|nr:sn-glycerol-3-phosphate ABC transporter ATP-binding protein UgpC [Myxococcales bacterium]